MVSSLLVVADFDNMAEGDGSAVATAYSNTGVQFAGGDGSVGDPYQIEDVSQLQHVQENLSAHYVLIDDIDASGTGEWNDGAGFEPLASIVAIDPEDPDFSPDSEFVFNGTFDGDGHVISDLSINRPAEAGVGLFGIVYEHATIVDVGLEDVSVSGGSAVGTLVAWNLGTVQDSYATGESEGNNVAGDLVGDSDWYRKALEACDINLADDDTDGSFLLFQKSDVLRKLGREDEARLAEEAALRIIDEKSLE